MGTLNTHANLYVGRKGHLKLIVSADSYKWITENNVLTFPNFGYDVRYFGMNCVKRNKKGKRVRKL